MIKHPYYILIGKNPVNVDDLFAWGMWMEETAKIGSRHVGSVRVPARKPLRKGGKMLAKVNRLRQQPVWISTVFLGLDHSMFGGQAVLFESMVFGGLFDQVQTRYVTYDDALQGHQQLVSKVLATIPEQQRETE